MRSSQLFIDKFLIETTENFENNRDSILTSFDNEIDSLSSQIMAKLLT